MDSDGEVENKHNGQVEMNNTDAIDEESSTGRGKYAYRERRNTGYNDDDKNVDEC